MTGNPKTWTIDPVVHQQTPGNRSDNMYTHRVLRAILTPGSCSRLVMAVCVAVPAVGTADVYRWIDDTGTVHYGDRKAAEHSDATITALVPSAAPRRTETAPTTLAANEQTARIYDYPSPLKVVADADGVYWVEGRVNGRALRFIVDTGANLVTINRSHAEALGLPLPAAGETVRSARTASGTVGIFHVKLAELRVGNVVVNDALAAVTDNPSFPETPLLGMSFLSHAQLVQTANVLEIRRP
jgi:clan AA aspartic protease (TIGR02281 family)